ncbi:MAG: MarR family winged helix-turn-helix transcriptional regulator [Novosphingobium sp.]|jgi:DNA-binding MarR family transcriptional regulator|uniref:MarR family winged helix-turn-helix transcriptional regulator n=1 Tax=Novosphingobium sp. TaxID=1874826 RepID=UPI00391B6B00|nr:MarR family transcriptional regulator [Novosphingobium sp.]
MTDDPLAFQLFTEIGIIDQLGGAAFERALPAGLTRAQFGVLQHLSRRARPSQSPGTIAAAMQVSRATMTSTLGRLAKRGLVAIEDDPADGRGKQVRLTDAGETLRQACIAAVLPLLPLVGQALTAAEQDQMLGLLRKLREVLDTARDAAP